MLAVGSTIAEITGEDVDGGKQEKRRQEDAKLLAASERASAFRCVRLSRRYLVHPALCFRNYFSINQDRAPRVCFFAGCSSREGMFSVYCFSALSVSCFRLCRFDDRFAASYEQLRARVGK